MTKLWVLWCTALTFLTRLPLVARFADPNPTVLARSALLWPLVGALLGTYLSAIYCAGSYFFGASVAVGIVLLASVLFTGAFHEDGLADCADGLWGGFTPERRLEIMRDSRIGSYGAVALVLVLLLKGDALIALAHFGDRAIALALLLSHIWSRSSALVLTRLLLYVREGSSNKPIADGISRSTTTIGLLLALSSTLGLLFWFFRDMAWVLSFAATLAGSLLSLWWLLAKVLREKIGGYTGDALGACNQITEVGVLLLLLAALRCQ